MVRPGNPGEIPGWADLDIPHAPEPAQPGLLYPDRQGAHGREENYHPPGAGGPGLPLVWRADGQGSGPAPGKAGPAGAAGRPAGQQGAAAGGAEGPAGGPGPGPGCQACRAPGRHQPGSGPGHRQPVAGKTHRKAQPAAPPGHGLRALAGGGPPCLPDRAYPQGQGL